MIFFWKVILKSSEVVLLRHLGGIFGQPMLVAQVAIAHAERRRKIQALPPKPVVELVVEILYTLGTDISPKNGILKMIFLFPRWDMLITWRVPKPVGPE